MKENKITSYRKYLALLILPLYLLISCVCFDFNRANAEISTSIAANQIKNTIVKAENDYLYDAIGPSGKVVRWSKKPIIIYIPQNNYSKTIESAFKEWERASGETVTFKKTDLKSKADIQIIFTEKIGSNYGGLTKTYHQKNNLIKAEIFLTEKNKNQKPIEKPKMYILALHEIGHSLGIVGHSSDLNDVMSSEDIMQLQSLSANDINTLRIIYSDEAGKLEMQKDIFAKKLIEQEQKVKNDPDNKVQLLLLAGMYKNMNQYPEAMETYEKIIKLDPDFAQAYYSLGSCYYKKGEKQKSLEFFKQAVDKEPDNSIFLKVLIKVSCETNNKEMAKKYLLEYVAKHPEAKNDPVIKDCFKKF